MMATILSVGVDKSLLYTRRLIMEKSGATVRSVSPEQALLLISNSSFDLMVLCHTIHNGEAHQLCVAAHTATPAIKTLLIDPPGSHDSPHFYVDYRFSLDLGPAMLIWVVRRLLHGPEPDLLDEAQGQLVPFAHANNSGVRRTRLPESSPQHQLEFRRTSLGETPRQKDRSAQLTNWKLD
jgi:hypothetical protein